MAKATLATLISAPTIRELAREARVAVAGARRVVPLSVTKKVPVLDEGTFRKKINQNMEVAQDRFARHM